MEFLLSIKNFIFATGPFFLLLGTLIFIHELGHFLAARYFGVRVEVFSLGFGPKILKKKWGDTVYCLSLLPLGGYVKMYGDNPSLEVPEEEKKYGFLFKKPYQKWIIAFAGPFMNICLTVLIYFLMIYSYGVNVFPPELGDIKKESLAYSLGFRSGDLVQKINNQSISRYEDLGKTIRNNPGQTLEFEVLDVQKKQKNLSVNIQEQDNPSLLWQWKKKVGFIEGLSPGSQDLRLGIIGGSVADKAGLETFDMVTQINNEEVKYWRNFEKKVLNSQTLELEVKRGEEKKTMTLPGGQNLLSLGIESPELYIAGIKEESPAQKQGLKVKDRILSINGKKLTRFQDLIDSVEENKEELEIALRRGAEIVTTKIKPVSKFIKGEGKNRDMIGVTGGRSVTYTDFTVKKLSLLSSFSHSVEKTGEVLSMIVVGLWRIVQGKISIRNMGGPVVIGQLAHESYKSGFKDFLNMMALISLTLFFFNLLPIPALDGGHLLFFTIEGILRRPLDLKKLIYIQSTGVVFLMSFMGFVVIVDIYNYFTAW